MQTTTYLWIALAILLAGGLAYFHYYYRASWQGRSRLLLTILRAFAWLGLFMLLINPRITRTSYTISKAELLILSDNSRSMQLHTDADSLDFLKDRLLTDERIRERFAVSSYQFGRDLEAADSLDLSAAYTDLSQALASLNTIHKGSNAAVILLSDGNQTFGQDYEFYASRQAFPVYPVVVGDTARYEDLRISRVNVNPYAFLDNEYPVEVQLNYDGNSSPTQWLEVRVDGSLQQRKRVSFSKSESSAFVSFLLKASEIGLKELALRITPLSNEKNTANNSWETAIEVVDEKTEVALISEVVHPDLGALKKSIESNRQRTVSVYSPDADPSDFENSNLFILYNPSTSFSKIYTYLDERKPPLFTIAGMGSDWNFLNRVQNSFAKEEMGGLEEIEPVLNPAFSKFDISAYSLRAYPPLKAEFGEILITKPTESLVSQRVRGVEIEEPLLATIENAGRREVALFASDIWKWRVHSYKEEGDFRKFDALVSSLLRYLGSDENRERLTLEYQKVFAGNREAAVKASLFDETFIFDRGGQLSIQVQQAGGEFNREYPMVLKDGYYEADISALPAGSYDFVVEASGENLKEEGRFRILDFDVEQQILSSNYRKLGRLAANSDGRLYYPDQLDSLTEQLIKERTFTPTRKSAQNIVSLIDFKWLLLIIALALTAEWFIRKYNGLN